MKKPLWSGLVFLVALSGCSQSISNTDTFSKKSQAQVYGWISIDDYFSPVVTKVEVDMCQVVDNRCLTSAEQEYEGVQLPIQYSFLISPLQAGDGNMKIRARLLDKGSVVAQSLVEYHFEPGEKRVDIVLSSTKN
ncbi:YscW family type III secretion system pilotin [Vibrio bivalvicida]|uniref:Type III secretion system chaperone YscW n=1 Tax=Vibrio bivalvicida TaxID=1276888 RepID=A0A177XU09_9VIBR|nr:YscW family type III secretion system pilotin [Vibrio bivalvicida]OAJ92101.1 type III secretion system chaperone YscW [Vibrio bivalvicida]